MFCFHPLGREFHLFFSRVPQGENSSSLGQKFSRQRKIHINNSTLTSIFTNEFGSFRGQNLFSIVWECLGSSTLPVESQNWLIPGV
jgi:hypothetical protein